MSSARTSGDVEVKVPRNRKSYPWTRGIPFQQPFHVFSDEDQTWHALKPASRSPAAVSDPAITSFAILSWNIDFMRILPNERMAAALEHLHAHVRDEASSSDSKSDTPVKIDKVIMLNEMTESDLRIIQSQDWIREGFQITDLSSEFWESSVYGTCMLIPKSMTITDVFRVHYVRTTMKRDALFVDVDMGGKTIRLCTTHLESLTAIPPKRPQQLAKAAEYLHKAHAGILGGDLNAIQDFDRDLASRNDLKDAYLEMGHVEGALVGMTWGQMAATFSRKRHGLTRMDKMLFCGAVEVEDLQTFGMDVQVEDESDRQKLIRQEGLEKGWVTDHLGIKAIFRLVS